MLKYILYLMKELLEIFWNLFNKFVKAIFITIACRYIVPPGGVNSNNSYVKLDYLIVYQMGSCVSESC